MDQWDIDLRQYWNIIRRRWWIIVLGAVLAGTAAYLISRNMTPVYQTGTTLLVTPGSTQALDNYSSVVASQRLAQTYARLIQSRPIIEQTYQKLGLWSESSERTGGFSVSSQPIRDTQLIQVQVTGTDPDLITEAANTLAQVFIDWQNNIQAARFAEAKNNLLAELEDIQANIDELEDALAALQAQGEEADPAEIARLQDRLAQYRNDRASLQRSLSNITLAEATSGATITIVSPATRPYYPIAPRVMRNTMLAALVGAMLATGLIFFFEYLDDTVKTPDDLKPIGLTAVATVQKVRMRGKGNPGLLALDAPNSLIAESFRTLRTNLQFSSLDNPLRSIIVTSALAAEGKTTTAANLAVVWAQAGKRVILIDADLRRPSIHKQFGLPNRKGLTTLLVAESGPLNNHLQQSGIDNLQLLTSGPIPPNPQELLGSQRMADLLRVLERRADIVIVDTPPVLAVADANVLAPRSSGVLLVVDSGRTRRAAIQQAVESLRNVNARPLGVVLNRVDIRHGRGYYYYYDYYSHYHDELKSRRKKPLDRSSRRGRRPRQKQKDTSKS